MEAWISKYKLGPGLRNKNCGTGLGDWAGNQGQGWAAIIRARDTDANTLLKQIDFFFFFNWDSLHARLNSQYEAWSYKKGSTKKRLHDTENLFRKNLQLKDVC